MRIEFGKVTSVSGGRVKVALTGSDAHTGSVEGLLVVPGGSTGVSQLWAPPSAGDIVAAIIDDIRPENTIILGGVYRDTDNQPWSGAKDSNSGSIRDDETLQVTAKQVIISDKGSSYSDIKWATRDDKLQKQLKDIKDALDTIVKFVNAHTHPVPDGTSSAPTAQTTNSYSVGATAATTLKIK